MDKKSLPTTKLINQDSASDSKPLSLKQVKANAEEEAIRASVLLSPKNMSLVARQLSVSRATLYRLMAKYNI
jgi:transcriptional regulator with PAS, ATPase and Fis domain